MRNYEEAIQHAKVQCRHGEEVHCSEHFTVIAQKCRLPLCRLGAPRPFPHPTKHGSLRNIEAEHLQLAMNPWRTSDRVLGNHAENDLPQFPANTFSPRASPMSRKPDPIQLESRPMPANDRLRLDEDQCSLPASPEAPQHHPEQFVGGRKSRWRMSLFENAELLPKGQVFQEQIPT